MKILTFDIEEWVIYNNYDKGGKEYFLPVLNNYLGILLDLLDLYNQNATFFCLGHIAKDYPDVIKKIAERGHDFGCHSSTHKLITEMTPEIFYRDTETALKRIEDICGEKVTSYRAPAFSITEKNLWAFEILADLGITIDCSLFPTTNNFSKFPPLNLSCPFTLVCNEKKIKEMPINTVKIAGKQIIFSGGGYFRLIPYSLIKKWTNNSQYVMTYFHIRDFDKEQKRVYSLRYFKSYFGIRKALDKLQKYISEFQFSSVKQADKMIDWSEQPVIKL